MTERSGMTEATLQTCVERTAQLLGWLRYHTRRSKGSVAGFPDLILLRGNRCVAVELKIDGKNPTPAQAAWLTAFDAAGIETHVWRPADWHAGVVETVLRRVERIAAVDCAHDDVEREGILGRRWCATCGTELEADR